MSEQLRSKQARPSDPGVLPVADGTITAGDLRHLAGYYAFTGATGAPTTQAGYYSLLAFWLGGSRTIPTPPVPLTFGFYSFLGFWAGGAGSLATGGAPPVVPDVTMFRPIWRSGARRR